MKTKAANKIAQSLLAESGANLSTMMTLTKQTAQKTGGTMYSNIQNLSTGDIWLSSKHDSYIVVQTNIDDLLAKGQKSYTFSNLRSILSESKPEAWEEPNQIDLEETITNQYAGTYKNWYIGEIEVTPHPEGIHISSQFAPSEVLYPTSENRFYIPDAQIEMEFVLGEQENKNTLHFYENGNWSFSAWSEFDQ